MGGPKGTGKNAAATGATRKGRPRAAPAGEGPLRKGDAVHMMGRAGEPEGPEGKIKGWVTSAANEAMVEFPSGKSYPVPRSRLVRPKAATAPKAKAKAKAKAPKAKESKAVTAHRALSAEKRAPHARAIETALYGGAGSKAQQRPSYTRKNIEYTATKNGRNTTTIALHDKRTGWRGEIRRGNLNAIHLELQARGAKRAKRT